MTRRLFLAFFCALALTAGMCSSLVVAAEREVSVVTPESVALKDVLALSGSVTARRQAMLSPRMDGLVSDLQVDAGDRVEQAEILMRLDTALIERELELARASAAEVRAAAAEADRLVKEATRLRGDNFIPATELASREAASTAAVEALGAAVAREQLIQEQLRRHELPAPFTGVIAERMAETGEWVNRGDPIFRLVATDPVWIDVNVPQEHFGRLSIGTPVHIFPDTTRGVELEGRIVALVPVSDIQARSFLVRIAADDPDGTLFPGTSAATQIQSDSTGRGLALPRQAVVAHPDGGRSIFVIDDDGRARRRAIRVVEESADRVVVEDNLSPNARVVVRGNQRLRGGDPVKVVDSPVSR